MGTFAGHLLPGLFFLFFGTVHCLNVVRLYVRARAARWDKLRSFCSSTTYPMPWTADWPVEALLKILASFFGICAELGTGIKQGSLELVNLQHTCMYAFFLLSGVVDLMQSFDWPGLLPDRESPRAALILAFAIEGLLFSFHLHGRSQADTQLHLLLVLNVVATILFGLAELKASGKWPLASMAFSGSVVLQGTWFVQIGFALYGPSPWLDWPWLAKAPPHKAVMFVTSLFTLHIVAVAIGLLLLLAFFLRRVELDPEIKSANLPRHPVGSRGDGFTALSNLSDSDA